jgi:hypothetical protein
MISLHKKKYICNTCGKEDSILLAVKRNHELVSELPKERIEDFDSMTEKTIYTYEIIRDASDFPLYKEARRGCCSSCSSKEITWIPEDNMDNVLNFYGPSEAGKWFRGFNDLSH